MGRYGKRLARLLMMPEDGLPVGALRPADSPALVRELARLRLNELTAASAIDGLPPVASSAIRRHFFHTWEDFLLTEKQGRPGKNDPIGYGHSLEHETEDSAGYLQHIAKRDPAFGRFLRQKAEARIGLSAFDTSVYITGETQSGKSYLSELLAWHLAGREKSGVWILDPHGLLARSCAEWAKILRLPQVFYFDVNLAAAADANDRRRPRLNPFDQLPDKLPATLDIVTQEQVNAFSIMANYAAMTDNMRNLLASCIHLMLEMDLGSMQELHRLMDDTRNHDLVARGTRLQNSFHRDLFRYDFRKKKYTATKEALATRLAGLLSSEALFEIVSGKSTFSVPHAFNTPGLYIFNLGKGVIGESAGAMLGRLILSQLQAAAFKREKDGLTEQRVPTKNYVFIDEFQNFVSPTTGTIVAEARKYGISLILIQQYVGQGIDQNLLQNILTNTPLKITGVGTLSNYEKVMASNGVEREGFEGLCPRRFHVSRRGVRPFVIEAHGFLAGSSERMTPAEQAAFRESQLSRFYRSPQKGAPEPPETGAGVDVASTIPPEEFTPPRASVWPAGASGKKTPLCDITGPPPGRPGAGDAAALAVVRQALGPAPERTAPPERPSPKKPLPRKGKSASPAALPPDGHVPAEQRETEPAPPDGEAAPPAAVSPERFRSARRRPKYPA